MILSVLSASILLATLFPSAGRATDCSIRPLILPIRNVTFPDGVGANRGIALVLSGQVQGMRMSTIVNNTRLRNILDCTTGTNATVNGIVGCEGASGSVYDTRKGSFRQVFNLKDWNVSHVDPQPVDGTSVVQGYDVANFTDGPAVISDYPIEVWSTHDGLNKSSLAMGPNSSTLERLVDNRLAPSSFFGIDYGSRSELYPRDGQVVFGGMNPARFDASQRVEFPIWGAAAPFNCPLQVLLSDVILTNVNGSHTLFSDPDAKVSACIDTVQNAFSFTPAMFATFQNLTNHTSSDGSNYGPQSYPPDREPLVGTLTIKLANGYTTVIPHYELVTHERGTDAQGKYAVVNNSRIMVAVQPGKSDLGSNVPILGGVFLSQNYLAVDYNAGKFWLSPQVSNGTAPDQITTVCVPGNTTAPSPTPAATSSGNGSSLGLKVGVPVGVVGGLVVLSLVFWSIYVIRKRKLAPMAEAGRDSHEESTDPSGPLPRRPSELQGKEMRVDSDRGATISTQNAYELPGNSHVPEVSPIAAGGPWSRE